MGLDPAWDPAAQQGALRPAKRLGRWLVWSRAKSWPVGVAPGALANTPEVAA
jgi:hypothetical protein